MPGISIHDNHILEFTVDADRRLIRLRTAFPMRTGPEFTDIVFEGVEAYTFRGDALGTILFDIEQVDPLAPHGEFGGEMQHAARVSGGHANWVANESSAAAFLSAGTVRGVRVSSSVGLEGAVWARDLSVRKASVSQLGGAFRCRRGD